jgi:Sel1 repeat
MRIWDLIAPAFLAIIAAGFSAHVGTAQTAELECKQLSNVPDDGTPLAVAREDPASKKIDLSQAEAACRSVLRADPTNPTFMFQLGRALSLGNKRREAIKYYLDAADRGHAGAMNDLGGIFEYGVGVSKNLATALVWYERCAKEYQLGQELVRKGNNPQQSGSTGEPQASRRSGSSRRRPSCRETSVLHSDLRSAPPVVREFRLCALFCNS